MHYWFNVYYHLLVKAWNGMTPMQYGCVLVAISLVGWVLMKNGTK